MSPDPRAVGNGDHTPAALAEESQRILAPRTPFPPAPSVSMSLGEHLEELRRVLIKSMVIYAMGLLACAFFYDSIFELLKKPVLDAFASSGVKPDLYSGLTDSLMVVMKGVLLASLIVTMPLIVREAWGFVSPGLKELEIRAVRPLFLLVAILFACGSAMAYFYVAPLGISWLLTLNNQLGMSSLLRLTEAVDFTMSLMLVFGFSFQTPIVVMTLIRTGIVESRTFRQGRRWAIMAIVLAAGILTPPDVVSQLVLAACLLFLYELGIILGGKASREGAPKPSPS
ncbi:MAG: twin-arginine translocase subunit TatC [Planctomycetota bacterium]